MKKPVSNIYSAETDVKLILDTGRFLFTGAAYSFDRGRKILAPSKFSAVFLKPKYTGAEKSLLQNFMVECFTVAGVLNYDLQQKLKSTAAEILKSGEEKDPYKKFIKSAKEIIPRYQADGKIAPDGHLKTNFRTAVSSAYHGSLWNSINNSGIYAAAQYSTAKDNMVRPEHRLLEGKIYYLGDPILEIIWTPNGHNCRCKFIPLTHAEIAGKTIENAVRSPEEAKQLIKDAGISKDFARNSGSVKSIWGKWLDSELRNKNVDEIFLAMKEYARDNMPAEDQIVKESLKNSSKLFENSNEVWGERHYSKSSESYSTTVTFIRIKSDHIEVIISKDGQLGEVKKYGLDRLDDLRKGVLININN